MGPSLQALTHRQVHTRRRKTKASNALCRMPGHDLALLLIRRTAVKQVVHPVNVVSLTNVCNCGVIVAYYNASTSPPCVLLHGPTPKAEAHQPGGTRAVPLTTPFLPEVLLLRAQVRSRHVVIVPKAPCGVHHNAPPCINFMAGAVPSPTAAPVAPSTGLRSLLPAPSASPHSAQRLIPQRVGPWQPSLAPPLGVYT